jgi:hypothetical protein
MDFEPGRQIGPWTLNQFLGEGGNAEVWNASREGEPGRALKILRDRRPDAVAYRRFRREVETHQQLGERADVVPMLDWHLPEQLGRRDRAWLSMPLAESVRDALSGASLEEVVGAVAAFATTLADLQISYGIAHRDVKPGNLYRYNGAWAVGDLGLVDVPGAETLTAADRVVGPANFVAYEMMVEAATADPHLADVYSLAKTLWVLAADQVWPPPGHQPAADTLLSIGSYRQHGRTDGLARLIDRCTRRPNERPTLAEVAAELRAWLDEPSMQEPPDIELGDVAARIRAQLAPERNRQELERERLEAARADADLLARLLRPLQCAVAEAAPDMHGSPTDESLPMLAPMPTIGEPNVLRQWALGASVIGPGITPMIFDMAALLAALDDGQSQLGGAYLVKRKGVIGVAHMERFGPWRFEPGTEASRQAVQTLVTEMSNGLALALQAFADALQ